METANRIAVRFLLTVLFSLGVFLIVYVIFFTEGVKCVEYRPHTVVYDTLDKNNQLLSSQTRMRQECIHYKNGINLYNEIIK